MNNRWQRAGQRVKPGFKISGPPSVKNVAGVGTGAIIEQGCQENFPTLRPVIACSQYFLKIKYIVLGDFPSFNGTILC